MKEDNLCPECKIEMEAYDYFSCGRYEFDECQLCCPNCGRLIKQDVSYCLTPKGYIFKPKNPEFIPQKHFTQWLNQILGNIIPKDVKCLNTIHQYIIQNNINNIIPESLREILKNLKLSKYYKYTSYLFRELTGVGPPNIPEEFKRRAHFLFRDYIETRKKMYQENPSLGSNNPQYQFLIYKIFDVILPINDMENRRVFHFIHLPSKATLKKRNVEWDIIWNKCKEIK